MKYTTEGQLQEEQSQNEQSQQPEFEGGQVTALSVQKGNPDRLNVFVNEQFAIGVRREVALKHGLKKGLVVTVEQLFAVWREEESYKARDLAARYLMRRARSCKEMGDYLSGKGFDESVVSDTLEWLTGYGYLNDAEFAKQWVENRTKFKPRGKAMLRWELKQKGVSADDIESAIAEELGDFEQEVEAALLLLRKKTGRKLLAFTQDDKRKLAQFLSRRGFPYAVTSESIKRLQFSNLDND